MPGFEFAAFTPAGFLTRLGAAGLYGYLPCAELMEVGLGGRWQGGAIGFSASGETQGQKQYENDCQIFSHVFLLSIQTGVVAKQTCENDCTTSGRKNQGSDGYAFDS